MLATNLALEANPVAGVIPGDVSAVVPRAGVMRAVVEFAEMGADEVVDACPVALVEVRQGRKRTIRVG